MLATSSAPAVLPAWPLRLVAVVCLVLVGLLSWLAVDVHAHHVLHAAVAGTPAADHAHGGGNPDGDAACVITQFLAGATDLLVLALLALLFVRRRCVADVRAVDWRPRAAAFGWHAPGCGPPSRA